MSVIAANSKADVAKAPYFGTHANGGELNARGAVLRVEMAAAATHSGLDVSQALADDGVFAGPDADAVMNTLPKASALVAQGLVEDGVVAGLEEAHEIVADATAAAGPAAAMANDLVAEALDGEDLEIVAGFGAAMGDPAETEALALAAPVPDGAFTCGAFSGVVGPEAESINSADAAEARDVDVFVPGSVAQADVETTIDESTPVSPMSIISSAINCKKPVPCKGAADVFVVSEHLHPVNGVVE
ncbi:hypothetical protein I4F81_007709 [Pyropia yezoensis]|uniref:Uncharacterized protein n=1 Tax=Pyropia yezoensis TaxID=2788 RepID=A0ACC3C4C8_PYRYE|nr:hypothetical protein I4F81_007709 [Neopyropia yezoensis]